MKKLKIFIICILIGLICTSCRKEKEPPANTDIGSTVVRLAKPKNLSDMKMLIESFEENNPNIKIEELDMPRLSEEQHSVYLSAMSGNDKSIDIYWLKDTWMEEFAGNGYLEPLNRYITPAPQSYIVPADKLFSLNGNLYALPVALDMNFLFYKKEGADNPEELLRESLLNGDSDNICMANEVSLDMIYNIIEMKSYMKMPYADVIKMYKNIIRSGEKNTNDNFEYISAFKTGRAELLCDNSAAWNELNAAESAVTGTIGAKNLPSGENEKSSALIGCCGLGINAESENKTAAAAFLKYLQQEDSQYSMARYYGIMPINKKLYYDDMVIDSNPHFQDIPQMINNARTFREMTPDGEMVVEIENALSDYIFDRTNEEKAVKLFENEFADK